MGGDKMQVYRFTEGFYAIQDGQLVEIQVKQMHKDNPAQVATQQKGGTKICPRCHMEKPLAEFHRKGIGKRDYSRCLDCREHDRLWYWTFGKGLPVPPRKRNL
jgi:hypothetical protein